MIGFSLGASAVLATNGSEIWSPSEPPVFTVTPPEAVNISGVEEPVRINCSATGSPLPKITWYKNNITLPADIYVNDDEVTSELVIGQPKPSLQITYTCVARNLYNDELKTSTKIGEVCLEMQ